MSQPAYAKEQYALDKINVHETMAAFYWYADIKEIDQLVHKAFAPRITLDYSDLFGWPAKEVSAQEQADQFKKILPAFEDHCHVLTPSVVDLPAPDGTTPTPSTCKAFANVFVYLRKQRDGKPVESCSYSRIAFDLVRLDDAGNPWRIARAKFSPVWTGDPDKIWE